MMSQLNDSQLLWTAIPGGFWDRRDSSGQSGSVCTPRIYARLTLARDAQQEGKLLCDTLDWLAGWGRTVSQSAGSAFDVITVQNGKETRSKALIDVETLCPELWDHYASAAIKADREACRKSGGLRRDLSTYTSGMPISPVLASPMEALSKALDAMLRHDLSLYAAQDSKPPYSSATQTAQRWGLLFALSELDWRHVDIFREAFHIPGIVEELSTFGSEPGDSYFDYGEDHPLGDRNRARLGCGARLQPRTEWFAGSTKPYRATEEQLCAGASDSFFHDAFATAMLFHSRAPKAVHSRSTKAAADPAPTPTRIAELFVQLLETPLLLQRVGLVIPLNWNESPSDGDFEISLRPPATLPGTSATRTAVTLNARKQFFFTRENSTVDLVHNGLLKLGDRASKKFGVLCGDLDGWPLRLAAMAQRSLSPRLNPIFLFNEKLELYHEKVTPNFRRAMSYATRLSIQSAGDARAFAELWEPLRIGAGPPEHRVWTSAVIPDLEQKFIKALNSFARESQSDPRRPQPRIEAIWDQGRIIGVIANFGAADTNDIHNPPPPPLPRTIGICVNWINRSRFVEMIQIRQKALANTYRNFVTRASNPLVQPPTLYASDLVVGYVPEVRVRKRGKYRGPWRSLTRRIEYYDFGANGGAQSSGCDPCIRTSGVLRLPAVRATDGAAAGSAEGSADIHASSLLFTWNGLPMGVPPKKSALEAGPVLASRETILKSVDLDEVVPLRFNVEYDFRARVVDIGGALPEGPQTDSREIEDFCLLPSQTLKRLEPIAPPAVLADCVQAIRDVPGRALTEMIVSRESIFDTRWIVPPRANRQMIEWYGKLDGLRGKLDHGFHGVHLLETGAFPFALLQDNGEPIIVRKMDDIPGKKADDNPNRQADAVPLRFLPGLRHPDIPYYPDPPAHGCWARLRSADGTLLHKCEEYIPFYPLLGWPDAAPFSVSLACVRRTCLHWNGVLRILTVGVARGCTVTLELRSGVRRIDAERQLEHFYAYELLAGEGRSAALDSRIDTITPPLRIRCRHAIAAPRTSPRLFVQRTEDAFIAKEDCLIVDRKPGESQADLRFDVTADIESTDRVRVIAAWEDPNDDPKQPYDPCKPDVSFLEQLVEEPVSLVACNERFLRPIYTEHRLPDTRYRVVRYQAIARSRYERQIRKAKDNHRERRSTSRVVEFLNVRRPEAARLAYITPTFSWHHGEGQLNDGTNQRAFHSKRRGRALRVYLERGWFSSGRGELIALLTATPNSPPEQVFKYTCWGLDTLRMKSELPHHSKALGALTLHQIGGPTAKRPEGKRKSESGDEVGVVTFKPEFDRKRELWYFDVEFSDVRADQLFVRMAMARFQGKSIPDCDLSTVTRADFAQLLPDRCVTVWRVGHEHRIVIRVTGITGLPGTPEVSGGLWRDVTIRIYKQNSLGAWTLDSDLVPKDLPGRSVDTLREVSVDWGRHRGPRYITVQEFERVGGIKTSDEDQSSGRVVYADILEV